MSIDKLYKELRYVPDDYLAKELNEPSEGYFPKWLVLGEMQEREQQRQTEGQNVPRPPIAAQYSQPQRLSTGGLVGQNPYVTLIHQLRLADENRPQMPGPPLPPGNPPIAQALQPADPLMPAMGLSSLLQGNRRR